MSSVPPNPKIYHITHIENLAAIASCGVLWSDAQRLAQGLSCQVVGMNRIKQRRLTLPVTCHPGTCVGDYVPFNFCPRSVMLYMLHRSNNVDIAYHGGQQPIVHLQGDLTQTAEWASQHGQPWAFTDQNASACLAQFFDDLTDLDEINWDAVAADRWRPSVVKEGKQAEFLMHDSFPWSLIERIGVRDTGRKAAVEEALAGMTHKPLVSVEPSWYY